MRAVGLLVSSGVSASAVAQVVAGTVFVFGVGNLFEMFCNLLAVCLVCLQKHVKHFIKISVDWVTIPSKVKKILKLAVAGVIVS